MLIDRPHSRQRRQFEICLYNRQVLLAVKENREHHRYSALWADMNRQIIQACDEAEARALLARRYPADEGFVISSVSPLH